MIRDSLRNLLPENWKISTRLRRDPRALMRRSLLRILAVAHDQRLDNATLISNLADEHRGSNRRLLRRLARRIDGGLPLVAALEQTPDVLSDHQVLAIRYGSQSGTLPATYQSLIIQEQTQALTASGDLRQTALYLATMGFILLWIVSFLMTFIYPTIEKMLSECGVETPWVYGLVTRTYHQLGPAALLLLYGSMFAIPLLWASPFGRWLRRRAADSRLHWVQQLRIAELLELLAQSVEAGRPLSGALSTLARYHFDRHIRARLLFARNEVEQGAEVWDSLRDANLMSSSEAHALTVSSSPAARAWLLNGLARQKRERILLLAEAVARAVQTLVILALAAIVLLLSLTVYQFLAELVFQLS